MNNMIKIDGVIQKSDGGEISDKEQELLHDSLMDCIESHDMGFGGIVSLTTDEEQE